MTLDEMRAAMDTFERDGIIAFVPQGKPRENYATTNSPGWNCELFDYFPTPPPKAPPPPEPKPLREWWLIAKETMVYSVYPCKQCYYDQEQIHVREAPRWFSQPPKVPGEYWVKNLSDGSAWVEHFSASDIDARKHRGWRKRVLFAGPILPPDEPEEVRP